MKMRSNRLNNGFVGSGQLQNSLTGCISLNKHAIDNLYVQQFVRPYSRPSEWVALPTVSASEQKVVLIWAVYDNDSNFTSFDFQGNYTVDWGDGSGTSSYSSGVTAEKIYTRATYSALSSSVYKGYKTLLITITPQAGQNLTSMSLCRRHGAASLPLYYSQGLLAVRMSAPNLSTAFFTSADEAGTLTANNPMLEEIEWIGSAPLTSVRLSGAHKLINIISFPSIRNCTSLNSAFYRCYSLQLLPPGMFETNSATDLGACFLDCTNLLEVPSFDTNACTVGGMNLMFTNCVSLLRIGYFRSNHIKNLSQTFQNCVSLIEIPPIDISSSTDNNQMFSGAGSLREIKGNFATPSASATNYNSMFANTASLRELPEINLANATTATLFMVAARNVRSVPPLNMPLVTNTTSFFNGCTQLEEISGITTGTALTNISSMFSDCRSLKRIPKFNTSKVTTAASALVNCRALTEVPDLDFSSITTMTTMFTNTNSLARFQVTGITSASFSVAGAILGATQLNEIYTNLGTAAGSPTITVSNNWGTATDNPAIATGKGWLVTG